MFVVVDRRRVIVVATFSHWADCVVFVEANKRHLYEIEDDPAVDDVLRGYLSQPKVDHADPS